MLAFQRVQPRLIWSYETPDMGKNLRRGQVVICIDSFGQIEKIAKYLTMLRVEIVPCPS